MRSRSVKRQLSPPKDGENSPPHTLDAKRSKLKSPTQDDDSFLTPKHRRALSPRSSNTSRRFVTPTPRRRTSVSQHRLSSIEFHGIPTNPLRTLVITESVRPSPAALNSVGRSSVSSYFTHRKRGVKKSDRTFADLNIPRLSPQQFEKARPKISLLDDKENDRIFLDGIFLDWKTQIEMGHNLLIYGFGSNFKLLETFGKSDHCRDGAVLSVDGFKGITAREILRQSAQLYAERDLKKASVQDMIDLIKGEHRKLYVLVNSIDSPSLRKKAEQGILTKLAACSNVVMVASMQHVNGCVLWDTQRFADCKWSLYAVHNCQHHVNETADRSLILNPSQREIDAGNNAADAAVLVLKSFVTNAQQVFLILALQKLSPVPTTTPLKAVNSGTGRRSTGSSRSLGLTFDLLYKKSKETFLVRNTSVLKSHLRDFIAHDLITKQRDDSGHDVYTVILENEYLDKVVKELSTKAIRD